MKQDETITITLNKYQRDNLLWLLLIAEEHKKLGFNTGDWVVELQYLLKSSEDNVKFCYPAVWDINPNTSRRNWEEWFGSRLYLLP